MIGIVFQWSSVIPLHCKMFQNSMHSQKIQRKEQRQQLLHWELQTDSCICNYAIMHPRMQNFANRRRTDDGLTCVALCSHLLSYALHPPCHWNHECCCTNTVFLHLFYMFYMLNLLADASWIQLIAMHGQWTKKYFAFYCSLQKTSLICIVRAMFCVKKLHC